MGVLDEIKAILSPTGAWLWAELGNNNNEMKNPHINFLQVLIADNLQGKIPIQGIIPLIEGDLQGKTPSKGGDL